MIKSVAIQRAVLDSDLPAPARLIMLTLLVRVDYETGIVPAEHGPSLTELADWTGLGRSTVARVLGILETAGWVERDRPDVVAARAEGAKTGYRLKIGGSPAAGLVPERDHTGSPAPRPPVVPQRDHHTAGGSPAAGRINRKTPTGSTDPPTSRTTNTHQQRARDPEPDRFDEFWSAYPRKVDKGHARRAWTKAIKAGADPDTVIAAAARYATDPGRRAAEPRFTPHASSWLNGERWLDVPDTGPARASPHTDLREYQGARLSERSIDRIADNARFAAMDAAEAANQPAIEGSPR